LTGPILCLFVALIAWMLIASGTHRDRPAACCVVLIMSARA
jgi:hypothetical protein